MNTFSNLHTSEHNRSCEKSILSFTCVKLRLLDSFNEVLYYNMTSKKVLKMCIALSSGI
jgi:hypothetical protein